MPFLKEFSAPNGASLSFHKVTKIESQNTNGTLTLVAYVASWPSAEDYAQNKSPLWTSYIPLAFGGDVFQQAQDAVLAIGDFAGGASVPDVTDTLEALKARKNAEINAARLRANRSTFTFQGKAIACDELSRSDIDGVQAKVARTGALPTGFPGAWKAADNTYVLIPDATTWDNFFDAMVAQGTANFMHSEQLKAQLAAAETPEEVEAIVW